MTVLIVADLGCARRPSLPNQTAIPTSQALPVDGVWRLSSGNTGFMFRIDKGRMFFLEKQKPLPKNSPLIIKTITKNAKTPSAADLSRQPGDVIVQDIQKTSNPLIYACQAFFYDVKRRLLILTAAEIQISSSTTLVLKIPPNPAAGLLEEIQDSFLRETLDNQTLFDHALLPDNRVVRPTGPEPRSAASNSNRKVISIPMDKMESNGQLSKSAKNFIAQTVKDAQSVNGWVTIKIPPNAPDAVTSGLMDMPLDTQVDPHITFYEMIIVKP